MHVIERKYIIERWARPRAPPVVKLCPVPVSMSLISFCRTHRCHAVLVRTHSRAP